MTDFNVGNRVVSGMSGFVGKVRSAGRPFGEMQQAAGCPISGGKLTFKIWKHPNQSYFANDFPTARLAAAELGGRFIQDANILKLDLARITVHVTEHTGLRCDPCFAFHVIASVFKRAISVQFVDVALRTFA